MKKRHRDCSATFILGVLPVRVSLGILRFPEIVAEIPSSGKLLGRENQVPRRRSALLQMVSTENLPESTISSCFKNGNLYVTRQMPNVSPIDTGINNLPSGPAANLHSSADPGMSCCAIRIAT
jgi:hypothetical protein